MFLIKWGFFQCFGKFSSYRNGRVKSFSSRGKEEKQSWGEKETEEGGKRTKIIFSFFVKTEKKRALLTFSQWESAFFMKPFVSETARAKCGVISAGSSGRFPPAARYQPSGLLGLHHPMRWSLSLERLSWPIITLW